MTEKELESSILDYLNSLPEVFAFKVQTTGIYDPVRKIMRTIKNKHLHKGTSDIIGVKDGKFFALEVKLPKKNPTDYQNDFLARILHAKGYATIVRSLNDAVQIIKAL
jgi:penicillin-binding protein-related factor A (putative recombinase)